MSKMVPPFLVDSFIGLVAPRWVGKVQDRHYVSGGGVSCLLRW